MYIDYEQNMYRMYNGLQPVEVKGRFNLNNLYQKRYLLNKIYSKFDFKLPEDFDLNTFRFLLFGFGSLAIFKKKDLTFFSGYSIESYNIYYNPYKISSRPITQDNKPIVEVDLKNQIVGKDAIIIKAFDDYLGFFDILNDYAETLACFDKAIKVALMNANVNLVSFAKDRKQAEEIKTAYACATEGQPLVIMDKGLEPDEADKILQPFTNHDIAGIIDKLLTSRRAVVNNFLTEIGIANANINKKERLNSDEVNANDEEVTAIISVIFENIKSGIDKANELFGLNMEVKLRESEDNSSDDEGLLGAYEDLKKGGINEND